MKYISTVCPWKESYKLRRIYFLVEAIFFFTTWILEILGDIVGSSVEKSEICININSPCHFSLHALDSLSSLEALSIFNSLIDIIPQSITMQILKYFQSISLQQDEGGGCTRGEHYNKVSPCIGLEKAFVITAFSKARFC